jgi:hypothetical protein
MDETTSFASPEWWLMLGLLLFSRGMDFLSTWVATPHLVLEGNPVAKKLGWGWGALLNLALCVGFAFLPVTAVVVATTSVLVAARNFQSAWLMRSLGEQAYRDWYVARFRETRLSLVLFCLFGQTTLVAGVGVALICYAGDEPVPLAVGFGIVAYALAVTVYSLFSVWRIRRRSGYPPPESFDAYTDAE